MSAALALDAAPTLDPSPPPPCVVYDRSGGYRATVTRHAVRRFAERVLHLDELLEGLTDREALDAMRGLKVDVEGVRRWLAFYGYPGPRWGAKGVVVGRVGLVLQGHRVVTVVTRD
ncbi:hypothetical protein [Methylobacterium iners]|uniref:Uncharacterized protein n=1 Tax=Methylobacterium iners TaxID=418707 RepID=A0ABQ4S4Y4_9HYPH|nr:hypothetical protein [Methylobacterium iners]GJD97462.1 hypothetical protein OCOJLMKI_4693 [Methylobacterium iners]